MKKETLDKYIGLTVGCLTVIELDHETKDLFLQKIEQIYHNFHNESSTTISKESTSEANADGNREFLNAA